MSVICSLFGGVCCAAELVDLGAIPSITRQPNQRLKQQTVSGTIAQVTESACKQFAAMCMQRNQR